MDERPMNPVVGLLLIVASWLGSGGLLLGLLVLADEQGAVGAPFLFWGVAPP
jgi:hypothetical protein